MCYLNYAMPVTLSRDCINQSEVAAGTGSMVASVPVTDTRDRTIIYGLLVYCYLLYGFIFLFLACFVMLAVV